jgi:hypothetical protein
MCRAARTSSHREAAHLHDRDRCASPPRSETVTERTCAAGSRRDGTQLAARPGMTPHELDETADDTTARSSARLWFRLLQVLTSATPVVIAAPFVAKTGAMIAPLALTAAIGVGIAALFQWRLSALRRDARRTAANLAAVTEATLGEGARVIGRAGFDRTELLASNPRFARRIARCSVRFAAVGAHVELGAAVVALRDFDVVQSYVKVRAVGLPAFRAMTRGFLTSWSRWLRTTHPVATGDTAFDARWVVDADEDVATRLLAPGVRARLVELSAPLVSTRTASIETIDDGIVIRWPGPLTPDLAARLRDLAIAIADGRVTR